MIEREIAWRVFAHEFNNSNHFFHEGDERSPNYLVTPTGARINRLYFVGVLTEAENIGVEEDLWRARISDPTGAFTLYAGQYQSEAAIFLSGLEIPSFAAIVGKARTYEPEEGTVYTSVRPEEMNSASNNIRDRWILDTARLTIERIRLMRTALGSGHKGDELIDLLIRSGASAELADGISRAIEHYPDLEKYLDTLSAVIIDALKTLMPADPKEHQVISIETDEQDVPLPEELSSPKAITSEYPVEPSIIEEPKVGCETSDPEPEEPDELVYELMGKLDKGKGVAMLELMKASRQSGLTDPQVDDAVKSLMSEGRCYEPKIGMLRKV